MLPGDLSPWAVVAGFVVGLAAVVLEVVRRIIGGGLVPRITHQDVIKQRDTWQKTAEAAQAAAAAALATNATQSAQLARILATQEQGADTQRELVGLVRTLVPQVGREVA